MNRGTVQPIPRFDDSAIQRFNALERRGGSGPSRWLLTVQQAIRGIEDGSWLFCVLQDDRVVPVVITAMPSGEKYLKTATDEEQPELLLALVECSPSAGPPPASADCESPRD